MVFFQHHRLEQFVFRHEFAGGLERHAQGAGTPDPWVQPQVVQVTHALQCAVDEQPAGANVEDTQCCRFPVPSGP